MVMPIAIMVVHRVKPGMRDAARKMWEASMPDGISTNPGHLFYTYMFDRKDPNVIRAFQIYSDQEAAQAYLTSENYRQYAAAVGPLLAGPPAISMSEVVWSKGLADAG